jgi:hypothetical protein
MKIPQYGVPNQAIELRNDSATVRIKHYARRLAGAFVSARHSRSAIVR